MRYRYSARTRFILVGLAASLFTAVPTHANDRPEISEHLAKGQLATAHDALTTHLEDNPEDDLARFQAGAVQFFSAVEGLAQDSYRFGLNPNMGMVPFLRMPVKPNPNAEQVTYGDVRGMIERFVEALGSAEETLSAVNDTDLLWDLDLTKVRLDLNGDGQADRDETLWGVFAQFALQRRPTEQPESFTIGLDSADVHWLRGYCHLLSALGEMVLAYDHQRQFDHTAQLFFTNPDTPLADTLKPAVEVQSRFPMNWILDTIAFVHLADFPVQEPERLLKAHKHLLAMIESSRKSWELIEAETDNHREWIPGPGQDSVVEGVTIDERRLATWRNFLDEAESILHGKKLLPFWREGSRQGINLMKVFTEPRDFDLVLWVQGSAAVPYFEEGEITSAETWREFQRVFNGRFIGFAVWIN